MRRASLSGEKTATYPDTNGLPAIAGGTPVRSRANRLVFGAPVLGEEEIASVAECIRSQWIGLGPRVERLEQEFARYKGAPYALAVSSGTAAIHLALAAMGIGAWRRGDRSSDDLLLHHPLPSFTPEPSRCWWTVAVTPSTSILNRSRVESLRGRRRFWLYTCAVAVVRWILSWRSLAGTGCALLKIARTPSKPRIRAARQV